MKHTNHKIFLEKIIQFFFVLCYSSGMTNLTLDVEETLFAAAATLAVVLVERRDSLEPNFLNDVFNAAPDGLWTMHIPAFLFDGDRLTLCTGPNRPYFGRHSKYLLNSVHSLSVALSFSCNSVYLIFFSTKKRIKKCKSDTFCTFLS